MLTKLCTVAEQYGSGKSSGAGGGDCGIAFLKDAAQVDALYDVWKEDNIRPLKVAVSQMGAAITDYDCESSLKESFCKM